MTQDQNGARGFSRVKARIHVKLTAADGSGFEGTARDLSASGVFIECDARPPLHRPYDIHIGLGDIEDGPAVNGAAEPVRVEQDGVAVRFIELEGAESFEHLRNLVSYNAENTSQTQAEFKAHVGLKRWP